MIRRSALLIEAAKGPDNLPADVFVTITRQQNKIRIAYTDRDRKALKAPPVFGKFSLAPAHKSEGACRNAWVVQFVYAAKGYGPLLYDLAIEIASRVGAGLTPDRHIVSDDARPVWRYYRAKRTNEIKTAQLDDPTNTLTPDPADNCVQQAASEDPEGWQASPLSKVYRSRGSPTMTRLERLGKLLYL